MGELADQGRLNPSVTELRPATVFYIAEGYHQEYFANNPRQPYCSYVVAPKSTFLACCGARVQRGNGGRSVPAILKAMRYSGARS